MQPPDFEEPFDSDSSSKKLWTEVPEAIRKDVEEHVLAHLPANMLAKLHDLHAQGIPISSDNAFFHFGGGMAVRNLCRERLSDDELAAYCLFGDWDVCYIGVLAAIAALPPPSSEELRIVETSGSPKQAHKVIASGVDCRGWDKYKHKWQVVG